MENEAVLARLDPSPFRRVLGIAILLAMAGFLIWITFRLPGELMVQRVGTLLFAALLFVNAYVTWRATKVGIVLTESGLRDGTGRVLAEVANIREVARGALSMRPSQGFTVVLRSGMTVAWVPGLWWRVGKRVGIGGLTPPGPAKLMAEAISALLAARPM